MAGRPGSEPTSPAPTRGDDVLWMATKGTRWFLRRSVDLIPYMLFMAAREALVEPREAAGAGVPDWLPPVRGSQASIQSGSQSGIRGTQAAEPVAE